MDDGAPDNRLQEAMEYYLAELELGKTPDRSELLSRYSDVAGMLENQLDALDLLHGTVEQITEGRVANEASESQVCGELGDFRLMRPIGRGGMGVVYEALQTSLQRKVAVKVLSFVGGLDSHRLKRFQNEARAAASLDHPNIVPIFFVGQAQGTHFYAMQFIEGQSLADVIRDLTQDSFVDSPQSSNDGDSQVSSNISQSKSADRRQYYQRIARLGLQAAEGLQHAHEQGIVHRDVKPGNLLLDTDGKVWVTDFGLAHLEDSETLTAHGDRLGTLAYMSPEQRADSRLADLRSDIFSLGVTLYELLTQSRPFEVGATSETSPKRPRKIEPQIPFDLETILLKSLALDPIDRYQSAQDMADDLRRFETGHSIRARRASLTDGLMKWSWRHRRLVATAAFATALMLLFSLLGTWFVWQARGEAERRTAEVKDLLYAADVGLAYEAWDSNRLEQVAAILNRQLPEEDGVDRRDLAWYFLQNLAKQPPNRIIGRHEGRANELEVFSDQSRVATVGQRGKLRIWNIERADLIREIDTGDQELFAVAISPDGKTIATGSLELKLWEVDSGDLVRSLATYGSNIESLAFTTDGRGIVAGIRYEKVQLLDLQGDVMAEVLDSSRHDTLKFLTDGRLLIPSRDAARSPDYLRVWNPTLSEVSREVRASSGICKFSLPFPGGEHFLCGQPYIFEGGGRMLVIDQRTGFIRHSFSRHRTQLDCIAISSDEQIAVGGHRDGTMVYHRLKRSDDGELLSPSAGVPISAHTGRVLSVGFAGPRKLISCGNDGLVKLWELPLQANPRQIAAGNIRAALSPDKMRLAVVETQSEEDNLKLFSHDYRLLTHHTVPNVTGFLRYSPDSNLLATSVESQGKVELQLRDAATGEVIHQIPLDSGLNQAAFSPCSQFVAVSVHEHGRVTIFDTQSATPEGSFSLGSQDGMFLLKYTPDGSHLICAGESIGWQARDTKNFEFQQQASLNLEPRVIQFSPNQTTMVIGYANGAIRLWDWRAEKHLVTLEGHEGEVHSLLFAESGETLLSSGYDAIRLWSIPLQRQFGPIYNNRTGHWQLRRIAFTADGRHIVSNGPGGVVEFAIYE